MKKRLVDTTLSTLLLAGYKKSRQLISYGFKMYRRPRVAVMSSAKYARQRLIELKKVS